MTEHICSSSDRKKYHTTIVQNGNVTVMETDPKTGEKEIISYYTWLKFPTKEARIAYQIEKLPKCACETFKP